MTAAGLAICIPTYNRAEILRASLIELAKHHDLFDEVVISDNASPDHTQAVIEECRPLFRRMISIRQAENIGMMRNINAVQSLTRCRYQYVLADDDRILPEGFRAGLNVLASSPEIIAVYGGYRYDDEDGNSDYMFRYGTEPVRVTAADKEVLWERVPWLWLPIHRSDIFQRFCYNDSRDFGFLRLANAQLDHGPIWLLPDLFYFHHATPGRGELSIHQPWYQHFVRMDVENALVGMDYSQSKPIGLFDRIRARHEQSFLVAALSDAQRRGLIAEERGYLLRMRTLDARDHEKEAAWDQRALIQLAGDRLIEMLRVTTRRRLFIENGPLNLDQLVGGIAAALPELDIVLLSWGEFLETPCTADEVLLAEDWSLFASRPYPEQDDGLRWAFNDILRMIALVSTSGPRLLHGPNGSAHLARL